jgi:nucleotide-binding universal stress UspA family protein
MTRRARRGQRIGAMSAPILVGYQPLREDNAPVDFAAACAKATGAPLVVGAVAHGSEVESIGRELLEEEAAEADVKGIDQLRARLEEAGVSADVRILHGASAPRALHGAAEEIGAGLLVVGSTNRGGTGRVAIGSTAQRLMHGAPCPIAVVPHEWTPGGGVSTVGVAFADTTEGHQALHAAAGIARRMGASLRVLAAAKPRGFGQTHGHGDALTPAVTYEEVGSALRAGAERAVEGIAGEAGMAIEPDVSVGDPAEFLIGASRHVDLLVCGSRGYGPRRAVLLGGVSGRVTAEAHCPVIVLARGVEGSLEPLFGQSAGATA